jgi:hypothetical protein
MVMKMFLPAVDEATTAKRGNAQRFLTTGLAANE